jgi:integrase
MLYKRGKKYWVRFTIKGREIRVTSGTDRKTLAEEFERRLRDQIYREIELGDVLHTWEEATERWLKEKAHKRSLDRDRQAFAAVDSYLRGKALVEIDAESLRECVANLGKDRSAGTVNRLMAVCRGVLSAAVRWGWLNSCPKVEAQHVERHDPRFITADQFELLASELPEHLSRMARFSVATGLRWANVSGLKWEMVDLDRGVAHIPSGETKARRAIPVPLSVSAAALLRGLGVVGCSARTGYVFKDHLDRAPIGSPKTAWAKACKRAGLEGFRWHDLRHTWAAWHTMNGTPPVILKELGGWSSLAMVERYSALNPGHLSDWADNNSRTKKGTAETGE